ncbi:ATP-binding/permease protein CydD [secondary endosymbiont of Trabutina mannipara]|uniref:ATP-binding/permease protein CydD n=1 Tax=secondary endosymbiont of Trabutina mannipara TaxID=1835721 RepID=A0A1C3L3Y1_9ENTR|nr:cysteine/glutathione ABC transporter permease/ATP-binding protein CydD [secondary endosymbiont of Trabutina mannipara]SBT81987.1 ATP-binding/permease protein CydD [secondary endosymbiont of Trabutina mannipara]
MNNSRQKILIHWLNLQSKRIKGWLQLSILFGIIRALIIIAHSYILSFLLQALIIDRTQRSNLKEFFIALVTLFAFRAVVNYVHERIGFIAGSLLRRKIRAQILDQFERLGHAWIQRKKTGSWISMLLEQIENMQDFYARYLPQIFISAIVPFMILIVIFPINWISGLILFITAPMIPLFMFLVGTGAAEANRRNFLALEHLSGYFLDRLRGLETIRIFFNAKSEKNNICRLTEKFRQRTMEVLRLAFLSSGVLEFFSSIFIAILAVYFGFSYLGKLNLGSYSKKITLFDGFLVLILAPEFFQPLRDLGNFYHAKAKAVGAAESLVYFLEDDYDKVIGNKIPVSGPINLIARDLWILAPNGNKLAGPLNFSVKAGQRIAIIGTSGAGKSSLLKVLLGFLPYRGSILVNGIELRELAPLLWRKQLSWVSQNPLLPAITVRDNILLGAPDADDLQLMQVVNDTYLDDLLISLSDGINSSVGEDASLLSFGQAQRVALARALIRIPRLLLLDEPTASLDIHSERLIINTLEKTMLRQTTILVTHKLHLINYFDSIWVMNNGIIEHQGNYTNLVSTTGKIADF